MTCGASGTPEKKSSQIAQWRKAMAANDCEDQAWYLCIGGLNEINLSLCHSISLTYLKIQKNPALIYLAELSFPLSKTSLAE